MIRFKKLLRTSVKFRMLTYYLVSSLVILTVMPYRASAGIVPTSKSLEESPVQKNYDRNANIKLVMSVLNSANGKSVMTGMNVTADQMEAYLNRLNNAQLNLVAGKIRAELPPGGDSIVWSLLLVTLVVVLVFVFLDLTGVYKLPFRRGSP